MASQGQMATNLINWTFGITRKLDPTFMAHRHSKHSTGPQRAMPPSPFQPRMQIDCVPQNFAATTRCAWASDKLFCETIGWAGAQNRPLLCTRRQGLMVRVLQWCQPYQVETFLVGSTYCRPSHAAKNHHQKLSKIRSGPPLSSNDF